MANRSAFFGTIDPGCGEVLLETGELDGVTRLDQAETRFSANRPTLLPNLIVAHEGRQDGVGEGGKAGFALVFQAKKILETTSLKKISSVCAAALPMSRRRPNAAN